MNNTIDFKTAKTIDSMSKKLDHIDDAVTGFFSIMHMAMKNELGSAEPYFAATSPHTSVNTDAGQFVSVDHQGDTLGLQIFLDGVHIAHRQRCEVAILIEAVKNDRTDQIPLPHQLDNLFRIVTEAQRLVLRDADTLICFVEASQNVRRIVI